MHLFKKVCIGFKLAFVLRCIVSNISASVNPDLFLYNYQQITILSLFRKGIIFLDCFHPSKLFFKHVSLHCCVMTQPFTTPQRPGRVKKVTQINMAEVEQLHPPPSNYKSSVWKHFGFYKKAGNLDKTHAICKICRAAIKYTGSTTNLTTHLKRRHGVSLETPAASSSSSSLLDLAEPATASGTPGEQTIKTFFQSKLPNSSARIN